MSYEPFHHGYAFSQAQPLTYTWTDLTNNAFVSDELQPAVTLG